MFYMLILLFFLHLLERIMNVFYTISFQDIKQIQEKSIRSKTPSTEEMSETIIEEEEHGDQKIMEKTSSHSSLAENEMLASNTLQSENSVLREVTVTGGE